jgi:hypothetical protein
MIITTVSFITFLVNWYNNRPLTTDQAIVNHRHYCFISLNQLYRDLIATGRQFMVLIPLSIEQCVFFCWFGACLPIKSNYFWIVPSKLSLENLHYVPHSKSHVHIPSLRSFIQRIHPGVRLFMHFCPIH